MVGIHLNHRFLHTMAFLEKGDGGWVYVCVCVCVVGGGRERELEKASNISFSKEYIINASGIDLPGSQTP